MLPDKNNDVICFPIDDKPRLLVIVDAEEEFDWKAPFSRENRNVTTMSAQSSAQRIFEQFGIKPTYAVDYPVASQEDGCRPLLEIIQSEGCEIGAQLHPWVTPPYEEIISERNSFTNNLTVDLQYRKLLLLTETIVANLEQQPRLYRAGRYGAGEATPSILSSLGYQVDCSVLPGASNVDLAPSYSGAPSRPYWLASTSPVLEIPVTVGEVGVARWLGQSFYDRLASHNGRRLRLPAIASRTGIIERIRLSPEGSSLNECKRLTRTMLNDGNKVFVISYHSPSLVPGHTPYVRNERDLERFLFWLKGYLDFFFGELGGIPSTPSGIRQWAIDVCSAERRAGPV